MAAYLLRKLLIEHNILNVKVDSAGTMLLKNHPANKFCQQACQELFEVDLSSHRSQGLTLEVLKAADLVLCMTNSHLRIIKGVFPDLQHKCFLLKGYAGETRHLNVEDPTGKEYASYKTTCIELANLLKRCIPKIQILAQSKT